MGEILAIEMAALLAAVLSIGAADFAYHSGRFARRFHSVWVAASITAMCLPIVFWAAGIFVGPGAPAWGLSGMFAAVLAVGLYHNLAAPPIAGRGDAGAANPQRTRGGENASLSAPPKVDAR